MAAATVTALPTPQQRPDNTEIGVTLDLPFGTWNEEIYNPSEISVPDLLPRLDQMQRNDGHMRALYRLLSLPFRRCKWSVTPVDGGDEEADLITQIFERPPYQGGMTTSFDYIRACASKAMVNGFQVFEKVWDYQEIPGHGYCTVLRKMAPRAAKTIRFRADKNGGFDGVVQRAYAPLTGYKHVVIPKEKCFFFTVDKEEHPFYGRSMFEPALYHYDKKHKLYYLAHIAAQMGAVPGRLGYEDEDTLTPTQREAFKAALASFGFNTSMVVPKGFRVEPFEGGGNIGSEILGLITHHNVMSSQSVLGQFIDLSMGDSGGSTGSYALSSDSSDFFIMCEEAITNSFFECLTWYVVPQLIDFNFPGSDKYPVITPDPLADEMKAALVTIFESLATAKDQHVTADFMFELEKQVAGELGLEVDYDALEKQREEERAKAQVVTDAVAKVMGPGVGEGDTPPPELPDAVNPAKPGATGPGAPKPSKGGDKYPKAVGMSEGLAMELAERQADKTRLTQFARINDVGLGAGEGDQSPYGPIVSDIQRLLGTAGNPVEGEDGVFGPATAKAVRAFQTTNGLAITGRVDLATYALLLGAKNTATKPK